MLYYIYLLKFSTPLHLGDAATGGGLDRCCLRCSADTVFSALCCELAESAPAKLAKLISEAEKGRLLLSSLLPYWQEPRGELELYLPRPMLSNAKPLPEAQSYGEIKSAATRLKAMKKLSYVRASRIGQLLKGGQEELTEPEFAAQLTSVRVNTRGVEPLPYYVSSYVLAPDAGLYLVLGVEDEAVADFMEELLKGLGASGIGGKRSSGLGKFELAEDGKWEISRGGFIYEDDEALAGMLENTAATCQLCIAPCCPAKEELEIVKEGSYKLMKRGAFIASRGADGNIKGNSVYMLSEGSVFKKRLGGRLIRQDVSGVAHPVYRYGRGMFVGVEHG